MIHISNIHKDIESKTFSITYVAKDGTIMRVERCACTSFHSKGKTLNIKFLDSGEIRTVRRWRIIEFDGQEVVL